MNPDDVSFGEKALQIKNAQSKLGAENVKGGVLSAAQAAAQVNSDQTRVGEFATKVSCFESVDFSSHATEVKDVCDRAIARLKAEDN
eukprot:2077885-Pyramimonas_sp.AAC.1